MALFLFVVLLLFILLVIRFVVFVGIFLNLFHYFLFLTALFLSIFLRIRFIIFDGFLFHLFVISLVVFSSVFLLFWFCDVASCIFQSRNLLQSWHTPAKLSWVNEIALTNLKVPKVFLRFVDWCTIERRNVTSRYHGSKFLILNNFSWQRRPFELSNDGCKFFRFFFAILAGTLLRSRSFAIMATRPFEAVTR